MHWEDRGVRAGNVIQDSRGDKVMAAVWVWKRHKWPRGKASGEGAVEE